MAVFSRLILGCAALALAACTTGPQKAGTFERYVVASANPAATQAGIEILRKGGTAADAAVAIETTLGLVEPQSSGLGGGAFLVHYDAATDALSTFDGRETAPAAVKADQFLGPDGKPKPFLEQAVGGQSVAVPGAMAMLHLAQKEHGKLAWPELLAPATKLAEDGFVVGARMNGLIGRSPQLKTQGAARDYFYDAQGNPLAVGARKRNPDYAASLRALAADPRAINGGALAPKIIEAVANAPKNPQTITLTDLSSYRAKKREPVCGRYHLYKVCGMGPPSGGATTVIAALGMLERFDLRALGAGSAQAWHLIAEAERLAYADRAQYLADPDFVGVPTQGLIDPSYLRLRSLLIDPERAAAAPRTAGSPPGAPREARIPDSALEIPSTSHFVVADRWGNVVSMTATIENAFGSTLMAAGFLLNNELTDFSPIPSAGGKPVANAIAPGKRPLSSMAPIIVFDDSGDVVMAVGSPGGKRIIGYVVKTIVAALDWNMSMQAAIDLPNVLNMNGPTEIEPSPDTDRLKAALETKGHTVRVMSGEESGLHGFRVVDGEFDAAADKRREGTVDGGLVWWPWRWIRELWR